MNYDAVSIVIPVYNVSPEILSKSFESVTLQSFTSFEAIIIDDSTNFDTSQFCLDYCKLDNRFNYIKPAKKLGLVNALNLGILSSNYELIARFDSDDICNVDRLFQQLEFLKQNKDIDVLGGNIEVITSSDKLLYVRKYPTTHREIARSMHIICPIAHPTVMFKKDVIKKFGYYDNRYRYAEDIDLWLRLLSNGVKFYNLDVPLVKYRQDALTRNKEHYKYFLKARLNNFNFRFFPLNVIGIIMLLLVVYMPDFILNFYYKSKYKIGKQY
jgi:glycosyltransferase involved in cell wall biosynthesis